MDDDVLAAAARACVVGRGGLPAELRERFTHGECEVFAHALHALTGWPVVVVGDGGTGCVGWVHAGVVGLSGGILDAAGWHEPLEWLEEWAPIVDAYGEAFPEFSSGDVDIHAMDAYE